MLVQFFLCQIKLIVKKEIADSFEDSQPWQVAKILRPYNSDPS